MPFPKEKFELSEKVGGRTEIFKSSYKYEDYMVTKNMLEKEGWENVGPYREEIGLENDLIRTELISGKTVRTFQEYEVWVYGTEYRKGNETKRVEEGKERLCRRQYQEETDPSLFIPKIFDK